MKCFVDINCDDGMGLITGFIMAYICVYYSAIYLNSKSANYSMLTLTLVSPTIITFFEIFPNLNTGIHYPLYIVITSIVLNLLSLFTWKYWEEYVVKGEQGDVGETDPINI